MHMVGLHQILIRGFQQEIKMGALQTSLLCVLISTTRWIMTMTSSFMLQPKKKWLGSSKNNISKLGSFKLLGWLATFFYGGIQAQS